MSRYSRVVLTGLLVVVLLAILGAQQASAQEAFVGEVRLVAFNFVPVGWLECNGQELAINKYQALFALLGPTFGGNGQTTFKLPDMRAGLKFGDKVLPLKYIICEQGIFPQRD
jgi:microcystin-dependent protein